MSVSLADDLDVVVTDEVTGINKIRKEIEEVSLETPSATPLGSKEELSKISGSTINSPEKNKVDSLVSGKDEIVEEYDTDTDDDFRSMSQKAKDLSPPKTSSCKETTGPSAPRPPER